MVKIYHHEIVVTDDVLDGNNHVNNVAYVQWMQDAAIAHATSVGGTAATQAASATWVARSHQIVYLQPAFLGDRIRLLTWIATFRKARSQRQYKFLRLTDDTVLATGATEWVFVDIDTGRPRSIPDAVANCFELVSEADEP
jgi:acyl-CoA thioester hydrolase